MRDRFAFISFVCSAIVITTICLPNTTLVRDYMLSDKEFVPAIGLNVEKARCWSLVHIPTYCLVTYRAQGVPNAELQMLHYFFVGGAPQNTVRLVAPKDSLATVVGDVGIQHIGNRIASFILLVALLAALSTRVLLLMFVG